MPPTSTIPESPPRPSRTSVKLPLVIAAVIVIGLLLFQVANALGTPDRIDLTIHNDTEYDLNTTLRSSPEASGLSLGPIPRDSTKTVRSIPDPGQTFVFEYSYGGIGAGTMTVDRADLEANDWALTIPAEIAEPLRAADLPAPPG